MRLAPRRTATLRHARLHFASLLDWATQHARTIASATEGFDLSTPLGRMFAQMIAMLAEGELEAIKERTKGSYDHLVATGRHRGGFLPFGYRAAQAPTGGYRLEVDPDAASVIHEIVGRILDGDSINSVVTWLNDQKIPTSLDRQRIRSGKQPKGCAWRVGNLSKMLRSQTLLGYLQPNNGELILDDRGLPVQRAEPIVPVQQWRQMQERLASRQTRKPETRRRANGAMLLRIAFCGICGNPMYLAPGRNHIYYRCASKSIGGRSCGNSVVQTTVLEHLTTDLFLARVGNLNVTRKVLIPGEDHTEELRQTEEALARLVERLEKVPNGGPGETAILARMHEHEQHLTELRRRPHRTDQWHHEPTGETFRELWQRLNEQARGKLLRDCHVRIQWTPTKAHIYLGNLEDLVNRVRDSAAVLATTATHP